MVPTQMGPFVSPGSTPELGVKADVFLDCLKISYLVHLLHMPVPVSLSLSRPRAAPGEPSRLLAQSADSQRQGVQPLLFIGSKMHII